MDNSLTTLTLPPGAYARYLRAVGEAHLALARELEALSPADGSPQPLRALNLGSLQQAVVEILNEADEAGLSPREITRALKRGDEPNVRTTLDSLRRKGVAELVPGGGPQRWRLADTYRGWLEPTVTPADDDV